MRLHRRRLHVQQHHPSRATIHRWPTLQHQHQHQRQHQRQRQRQSYRCTEKALTRQHQTASIWSTATRGGQLGIARAASKPTAASAVTYATIPLARQSELPWMSSSTARLPLASARANARVTPVSSAAVRARPVQAAEARGQRHGGVVRRLSVSGYGDVVHASVRATAHNTAMRRARTQVVSLVQFLT